MRMDIPLTGALKDIVFFGESAIGETPTQKGKGKKAKTSTSITLEDIERFLEFYPTAKIITIIETHCLENGCFVWSGKSPTTYQACQLIEVGSSCVPPRPLIDVFADSEGLHAKQRLPIPLRRKRHSTALSPQPRPKPFVWTVDN